LDVAHDESLAWRNRNANGQYGQLAMHMQSPSELQHVVVPVEQPWPSVYSS
jgi:hypothetical protein